jgi:hypothetical protein
MTANLDFSTGQEPRVSVRVSGWRADRKEAFATQARQIDAITAVHSAGGATSFYVYYDPERISESELKVRLTELVRSIQGIGGQALDAIEEIPPNVLTDNGESLTDNGEYITDTEPVRATAFADASAWTGIVSLPERVAAFKQLAPIALAAVDSLLNQLETSGDNGGPPLDERQEAIDALRALHDALGSLLAAAENPRFEWIDGEGLVATCAHFAVRAAEKLRGDPMPFAVSGLVVALCSVFGFPGLGGWLGAATLEMQKTRKSGQIS